MQNSETFMNQDFQTIDISASAIAVQPCSANSEPCSANSEPCSANSEPCSDTLTPQDIAEKIGASVRSVYLYAKQLKEVWSWLPETDFRKEGRYTMKALEEMKKLKESKNLAEYASSVTDRTGNYTPKGGSLARIEVTASTNTLAAKPLPEIDLIEVKSVDTSAIRNRTEKMREIDSQLSNALKELVSQKVDNKVEELDARIDDFMTEIETLAKAQAVKKLQKRQEQ